MHKYCEDKNKCQRNVNNDHSKLPWIFQYILLVIKANNFLSSSRNFIRLMHLRESTSRIFVYIYQSKKMLAATKHYQIC